MPNPYWDDQDRNKSSHHNPQQDEYRRGDAPFQKSSCGSVMQRRSEPVCTTPSRSAITCAANDV